MPDNIVSDFRKEAVKHITFIISNVPGHLAASRHGYSFSGKPIEEQLNMGKNAFYSCFMVATAAEIQKIEIFFKGIKLPKAFKLNAAITIHDLPLFIQRRIENVKNPQMSERVIGPRWDDLVVIRKLFEVQIPSNSR